MYYSTYDAIYFATTVFLAVCGIVTNGILFYMIIYKSPEYLSPYRIFLGNTALTQLLLAIVIMTIAPRVLTENYTIVNIYFGPSQFLGPWCCYMLYTTMLHLALNSYMSLMISMIYRCLSLRISSITTRLAVGMCLSCYALPFSMIWPCIKLDYTTNTTEASEITHHIVPNMEKYAIVIAAKITQPGILWAIFCCSVLLIPIYCVMYFCRWKTLSFLEASNFVSSQTKHSTERFVKALTLQSLVPLISIFPPAVVYILIMFGLVGQQQLSFFIAPCLCIGPIVDPMITTYYIVPYRRYISCYFLPICRQFIFSDTNQMLSQIGGNSSRKNSQHIIVPL